MTKSFPTRRCALFGGAANRHSCAVYALDEATRQRYFTMSLLVHDIDGSLAPAVQPGSFELEFEHGLFIHPCPLRTVALWSDGDIWMFRNLELNIVDGSVYKIGEAQQLAPINHRLVTEQLARMLARCGRDIITNITDRIVVPRDSVAEVFSARTWLTRNGYQAEW